MSDEPHTMNRRQLIRHSAWFGAAVGLAVVGGEVISHVAGTADAARIANRPTLRFAQVSDSHIGFLGKANPNVAGSFNQAIDRASTTSVTHRISSSTPATSPIWPHLASSIRSSR